LDRTRGFGRPHAGFAPSIGPRGPRLHFGSGYRPGISTGAGPFTYYHPIGSRKSPARPAGTGRTSVSAYERDVRRAAREQEWSAALDKRLTTDFLTAHRRVFSQHVRAVLEPPPEIDREAVFKQVWGERKRGISFFRLSARKVAKKAAREETDVKVSELRIEAEKEIAAQQAEIDHEWTLLLNNDPNTVVAALEDEFEETEAPAAPLGCHDGTVSVLLRFPRIDGIVPDTQAILTGTGRHSVKHRSQTERNQLYLSALAAETIAVAKQAFAAAPAVTEATVFVMEGHGPEDPIPRVTPLLAVKLNRAALEATDMSRLWAPRIVSRFENVLNVKGRTAQMAPISLSAHPEFKPLVEKIAGDLEWPVDPRCK
jgi:hypothetical protein